MDEYRVNMDEYMNLYHKWPNACTRLVLNFSHISQCAPFSLELYVHRMQSTSYFNIIHNAFKIGSRLNRS